MPHARRVLWGEGMFLRPQHFQQQALFLEQHLAQRIAWSARHGWGVQQCQLDEQSLQAGQIRALALSVLFRDGTLYQAPLQGALPASRDLATLPQLGTETTLYACLAQLQPYGGNAHGDEPAARPVRFRHAHHDVADLFTQALDADLTTLELNVRLMVEEENRDGYDAVPLCRLRKNATGLWEIAGDYLPPMIDISGSEAMQQQLRRLLEILLVKSQSLAAKHRERNKDVMEFGPSDVGTFWMLHTVNRNFARLNHLAKSHPLHPEELYLVLAEFCGELLTFSSAYTLADIPPYRHEALAEVLPRLDRQIRELLETVISARYLVIPLHSPRPSFYVGSLESDRLLEDADFYLSIQSEQPIAQLVENVPLKMKIGAPDDVEKILNSAMRGVSLQYTTQTPSAIPVRMGNHYFALDPQSSIYQRMLQSRSICIYVPQTLADLSIELIAVFR